MNTRIKMAFLLLCTLAFFAGPLVAGGHTAQQMERAGFDCPNLGPNNWMHCMDFDALMAGKKTVIPVKVFSEYGSELMGTELLLREDIYFKSLQPCPQDDLNMWGDTGAGYYACHHFSTGHH